MLDYKITTILNTNNLQYNLYLFFHNNSQRTDYFYIKREMYNDLIKITSH